MTEFCETQKCYSYTAFFCFSSFCGYFNTYYTINVTNPVTVLKLLLNICHIYIYIIACLLKMKKKDQLYVYSFCYLNFIYHLWISPFVHLQPGVISLDHNTFPTHLLCIISKYLIFLNVVGKTHTLYTYYTIALKSVKGLLLENNMLLLL